MYRVEEEVGYEFPKFPQRREIKRFPIKKGGFCNRTLLKSEFHLFTL